MSKRIIMVSIYLFIAAGVFSYLYRSELKHEAVRLGILKGAESDAPGMESRQESGAPGGDAGAMQEGAGQPEEIPTVEIPAEKWQQIGVKTVTASIQPMNRIVRAVGRIEYDERKLVTANTKIEGWIEKLHIDYTGRYVQKGEPLAEIYSPELVATQQEFLNVLRWEAQGKGMKDERTATLFIKDAQALLEAAKERLRLWDINDEQIQQIETTGKPIRTLTIYSPVSGYILQKMAVQGMRVMPGEKLFDVVDLSTLWILSDIYEYELPLIKVGQTARISLSYLPGKVLSARVDYVYPYLAGETRTAKVRFTIPNPGGELKPQMFTNVEIRINLGNRLALPSEAVIDTGLRQIIYVDRGEGNFEPREVLTGLKTDELVEVTAGLKAGEKVASSAHFLIDSEAQLKGVSALPRPRKQ